MAAFENIGADGAAHGAWNGLLDEISLPHVRDGETIKIDADYV